MARIESYLMAYFQKNPGSYRNKDLGTITEEINKHFNLTLTEEDVEAALLNIEFNGEYGEDVKDYPDNFEWSG